jgi:hypothetical protein
MCEQNQVSQVTKELAEKVEDVVRSVLNLYKSRFVKLDELREAIERDIKKEVGIDCYYYVDEYPNIKSMKFYEPYSIRLDVENATDSVRCEVGDHEVDMVYVRMYRGVMDLSDGRQFWLIMDIIDVLKA